MLQRMLANPHTSISAIVYVVAKLAAQFGEVWIPGHAQQFKASADIIESAAVLWLGLSAGDAAASQPKKTDETKTVPPAAGQP